MALASVLSRRYAQIRSRLATIVSERVGESVPESCQRYDRRLNTMRRLRSRKSFVLFGIAVVVLAACVPALSSNLPTAILTPLWIVAQAVSIIVVRRTAARCDLQPVALLSLSLFRAPPSHLAVA